MSLYFLRRRVLLVANKKSKEQTDKLIQQLNTQIDTYGNSPEAFKEYLRFMGNFTKYSYGNCALIQAQFKGANAVGTFNHFQKLGFSVKKDEKSVIRILQPIKTKIFQDKTGKWQFVKDATKEEKAAIKSGTIPTKERPVGYRALPVFDISQTTARAEDLPSEYPNKWLDGSHPLSSIVEQGVRNVMDARGITFSRKPWEQSNGVIKGIFNISERSIQLNPRNSDIQNCKTLIHELGHAILHENTKLTAPEKEFQAELTAFSVCSAYGIDTSDYSLAYLKYWTKDLKEREHLISGVEKAVKEITKAVNQVIDVEKEKWLGMNRDSVMKEFQKKVEGLYAGNYDVATPLLRQYDHLHSPYDSLDLRLDALAKMMHQETSVVADSIDRAITQIGALQASNDIEEQESYIRNENRQLQLKEEIPVVIKAPQKKQAKQVAQAYTMER